MNVGITFGGPNVVEINFNGRKSKFLEYPHNQTMPCTKGSLCYMYTI
jgi:hypothetical protein